MNTDSPIDHLSRSYPALRPISKLFHQVKAMEDELANLSAQDQELCAQQNLLKIPPPALPGRQESKSDTDKRANLQRGVEQKRYTVKSKVGQLREGLDYIEKIEARNLSTTAGEALRSEIQALHNAFLGRFTEQFNASMGQFFPGLSEEELSTVAESCFRQTPAIEILGALEPISPTGSSNLGDCRSLVAQFAELDRAWSKALKPAAKDAA